MPQKVLLGSREAETLQAVCDGLEAAGHHVRVASDFETVVSVARSRKVDLVVVTEALDGGTGSDVCAVLKDLPGHSPLLYAGAMLVPGADAMAPEDDPDRILEQAMSLLEGAALIDSLGDMQAAEEEETKPSPPAKAKANGNAAKGTSDASARRDKGFAEGLLRKIREADYFEILGVAVESSVDDARAAHAQLRTSVVEAGPSVPRAQLEEMLAALDEALDVLSEPALRAAYARNRL